MLIVPLLCPAAWGTGKTRVLGKKADRIVIVKSTRTMTLYNGHTVLKTYRVALSRHPAGPKERAGDHKVPEGDYVVDAKNAHSRFHLALHISYPNAVDRERARKLGVNPGGNIEIHGLPNKYAWLGGVQHYVDWTDGCIAVTNPEIEEIWRLVRVGTPVEIGPCGIPAGLRASVRTLIGRGVVAFFPLAAHRLRSFRLRSGQADQADLRRWRPTKTGGLGR